MVHENLVSSTKLIMYNVNWPAYMDQGFDKGVGYWVKLVLISSLPSEEGAISESPSTARAVAVENQENKILEKRKL